MTCLRNGIPNKKEMGFHSDHKPNAFTRLSWVRPQAQEQRSPRNPTGDVILERIAHGQGESAMGHKSPKADVYGLRNMPGVSGEVQGLV